MVDGNKSPNKANQLGSQIPLRIICGRLFASLAVILPK